MSEELESRIKTLRERIAHLDERYHRDGVFEVSDFEYDHPKYDLAALEAQAPELPLDASPSLKVGDDRRDGFPDLYASRSDDEPR